MKKNKMLYMLIFTISICCYTDTHAQQVYNIDSLIDNKAKQQQVKSEIEKLEIEIGENKKEDAIEVISISFVEGDEHLDSINNEKIKMDISLLQEKLDNLISQESEIQGFIKSQKQDYLTKNNSKFTPGIWPLKSYHEISSTYGKRIHPITKEMNFHRGIDIPAPENTDILASDDGIVQFAGKQNGYGNVVKIKHFDGKTTVYAHNLYNTVNKGDIIKKGQPIAKVGSTGDSTGNHVHFEVLVDNKTINPLACVNK